MGKKPTLLICLMSLLFATHCSKMKQGVGLQGVVVDEYRMTLDGDTFAIRDRVNDSLLIVQRDAYSEGEPCYLIRKESNGLYYIQAEEGSISSIDNTEQFVVFGNREVFDIESKGVLFRTDCDLFLGLRYLGTYGDKYLFGNNDSLCFSDNKYIELQPEVYYYPTAGDNKVHLTLGAQSMDVSPEELYLSIGKPRKEESSLKRFKKRYLLTPHTEHEYFFGESGFDVDLEIPLGNDAADIAIRRWMNTQIRNELFFLLEYNPEEMPISKSDSVEAMLRCLDLYSVVWEKLLRNDHLINDTLFARASFQIMTRKIVDCKDYVTYYFNSVPDMGGAHALPRSYYATFDKRRHEFLTTDNTVKKDARNTFATAVLRSMKKQHDEYWEEESEWTDYIKKVFSFSCPFEENDVLNELMAGMFDDLYYCDRYAGWKSKGSPYTLSDFPLPHLAIIPEGIVVTYHPYQADCFAGGEYHAVVPLKDIAGCLLYEYKQAPSPKRLDFFIKMKEE